MSSMTEQSSNVSLNVLYPATEFAFHAHSAEQCLNYLNSRDDGLTEEEVTSRQEDKPEADGKPVALKSTRDIFLKSFVNLMFLLLLAAACISFLSFHALHTVVILVALVVYTSILGFIEWKSQKSTVEIDELGSNRCTVKRHGKQQVISPKQLVIGDILVLTSGDVVAADARLIQSKNLQADEALLTGESILVPKNAQAIHKPHEVLTAQYNMVFSGTRIKTGQGEAVVTALENDSVMGQIHHLADKTDKRESPFSQTLTQCIHRIMWLVAGLGLIILAFEYHRGTPVMELLLLGITLVVAALPGILPNIVNLIYLLGLERLSSQNILIKNVRSFETLGAITTLCSDKTGTLTENQLELEALYMPELENVHYDPAWQTGGPFPHTSIEALFRVARLHNSTIYDGIRGAIIGDPIDLALYRSAPPSLEKGYRKRIEMPFDPIQMRSATLCEGPSEQLTWMIKGAPEAILDSCTHYMRPDGSTAPIPFSANYLMSMFNQEIDFENNYRVIGLAQKHVTQDGDDGNPYEEATFIGWICLVDPTRDGAQPAIERLKHMGVNTMIITGDQKATAETTAHELGIMDDNSEIWLYQELEAYDGTIPNTVRGFARTRPEDKLHIVGSLQQSGHVVAMVGDGINDTPALQKSDVAIAMGQKGSDVALSNADIVLLTDHLESIGDIIQQSRQLSKKIESCILYLISCNLGILFFLACSVFAGHGMPFTITQVLWLNLLVVTLPTLALALVPHYNEDRQLLESSSSDLLNNSQMILLLLWGGFIMLGALSVFLASLFLFHHSVEVASTLAFCTLAFSQTLNLLNVQSLSTTENIHQFLADMVSMPLTWILVAATIGLQLLAAYVPLLNTLLGTTPVNPMFLTVALLAACISIYMIAFITTDAPQD